MTPNEYQDTVVKRAAPITVEIGQRINRNIDTLAVHLNLYAKVAKNLDIIKKHIFYGKPLEGFVSVMPTDANSVADLFCIPEINNPVLLHALLGSATEAAELIEHLDNHDPAKAKKEVGDAIWYPALGAKSLGYKLEDAMIDNDAKLEARFKGGFTEAKAQKHDGQ